MADENTYFFSALEQGWSHWVAWGLMGGATVFMCGKKEGQQRHECV